jgi:hypothetical protein
MTRRLLALLAVLAAVALPVAGCASSNDSGTVQDTTTESDENVQRFPQGSSVGNGLGPPPPINRRVRQAAQQAGCTVKAFPVDGQLQPDGSLHTEGEPQYRVSRPATSGLHNPIWADWGVYDEFVPYKYQVHNLEHGGVIIHIGRNVPQAQRDAIVAFWRESPPFVLVTPQEPGFSGFPARGVVVTSWQRWMVCKPFTERALAAIRTYRNVYRGSGPEPVGAINSGEEADDLPTPSIPDEGAR